VLLLLYDVEKSFVNAGMPECWRKVSPATAFLPAVNFFSPASAFRHQGQSGTAGHGLVRHCPAMQIGVSFPHTQRMTTLTFSIPSQRIDASKNQFRNGIVF
jgi:hypothetical protein